MSFLGFSKFLAVTLIGGGIIAVPLTKSFSFNGVFSSDLFLKKLKDQNIIQEVSKEQLAKNKCKVLVTDLENKSQIIVCPSNPSVTFLFVSSSSSNKKLEKIKSFSKPNGTEDFQDGKWTTNYNLQFWLSEEQNRRGAQTIKISSSDKSSFEQLRDVNLTTCRLSGNKLSCKKSTARSTTNDISLDLATNQEFSIQ